MYQNTDYKRIKENKAMCLICNNVLVSKTRHDFNTCVCGNLSVDGGKDYVRRAIGDGTKYKELSTYYD